MKFKHIGGGCRLDIADGKECDNEYESEDKRVRFIVFTSREGHYYLPEEFEFTGEMSEAKMFEQEQINKASAENFKNLFEKDNKLRKEKE